MEIQEKIYEAVCLNNVGYEAHFEKGMTYHVLKRGKDIIEVEDIFGESKDAMVERFGKVIEVMTPERKKTSELLLDDAVANLIIAINNTRTESVIKLVRYIREEMNNEDNWFESVKKRLTKEEHAKFHKIVMETMRMPKEKVIT